MFVPSQDDRGGSAHAAALDLKPSTTAGLDRWATAAAPALAARRIASSCPLALRATLLLAAGIYLLALGGSIVTGINAPLLDGVPLCLGPTAFFWAYCLIAFPRAVRTRLFIEAVFVVVALGLGLACLSYLGAAAAFPLRDGQMIWVDRYLGFDWLALMLSLDHRPIALDVLDGAYATFTFQLLATAFVLVLARRRRDLDRFFVTFVCASLLAELASVVVPTVGPMSVLAGNAEFAHLHTLGRTTADVVLRLREGVLREIHLDAVNGIICFPSLHAAVAVIVPFTLRWNKPLFGAVVVLDSVMFLSAVPSGNHYFADVLGGVTVAGVAIVASGPLQAALARLTRTIISSAKDVGWAKRRSKRRPHAHQNACFNSQLAIDRGSCMTDEAARPRSAKKDGCARHAGQTGAVRRRDLGRARCARARPHGELSGIGR